MSGKAALYVTTDKGCDTFTEDSLPFRPSSLLPLIGMSTSMQRTSPNSLLTLPLLSPSCSSLGATTLRLLRPE